MRSGEDMAKAISALVGLCALAGIAAAQSGGESKLDTVTILGGQDPYLSSVPGASAIVSMADVELGRVGNMADALKFVPGVVAQTSTGGDQVRYSIRGSSLIRGGGTWGTGIHQLLDGFTLSAPVGSPFEYYDPVPLRSVEVLPGGNAFQYGSTMLGGAINYIPQTGHTSAPLAIRVERGRFGYERDTISGGGVAGNFDYYASLTRLTLDGWRDRSTTHSKRFLTNLGYQISPKLKTRLIGMWAIQYSMNLTPITLAQLLSDPSANPTTFDGNKLTAPGSLFLGSRTTFDIDDRSSLDFDIGYMNFPHESVQGGPRPGFWASKNIDFKLKYSREDTVFGGRANRLTISLIDNETIEDNTYNRGYNQAFVVRQLDDFSGTDRIVVLTNDFEATPKLWINTGLSAIWQTRGSHITFPTDDDMTVRYDAVAPRFGLRYQVTPDIAVFANYTRVVEPPLPLHLPQSVNNTYNFNRALQWLKANSVEVGAQGASDRIAWSLAAYHQRIRDEFLTVQIQAGTPTSPALNATYNASPTIHEGIEQTFQAILWKFGEGGGDLRLREAYTFNNFHYRSDPLFGTNRLPALPQQFAQLGLDYTHPRGFYFGVSSESVLERTPVDFANTISAPAYTIINARFGFRPPMFGLSDNIEIFFEGGNLTDEKYANQAGSGTTVFNARGIDTAIYTPGLPRNLTAGVSYSF
jgi:iron complex outermembrane receptor protein